MNIVVGFDFLHMHPKMESMVALDDDHIIVDRNDWEQVVKFFNDNPGYIKELQKQLNGK